VCKISQFATNHVNSMQPGKRDTGAADTSEPAKPTPATRPPEESLRRLRTRFSRRLESFGLGEGQSPLLTDSVDSLDIEDNPR